MPNELPERRPSVFMIMQPTVKANAETPDLSSLAQYGTVRTCVPAGMSPAFHQKRCLDLLEQRLGEFDPAVDYLVWSGGDTLAALMVGYLLGQFTAPTIDKIRWLRWDRDKDESTGRRLKTGRYVPMVVDFGIPVDDAQLDAFSKSA